MFRTLFSRRGGVAVAAVAVGVASLSMAFAGTAGATAYPDNLGNASLLVGSGSQTSYDLMTALSTLFNGSPGCDLTASTSTPPNTPGTLGCGTTSYANGGTDGEQGFNVAGENPYNDYSVQAPPIGSGNGASALEAAGSGTGGIDQIDYARASAHKGNTTTNDVAYAIDGVSWVAFNKIADVETPVYTDKIANLTIAQIQAVWGGTEGCTIGTVTYSMNWVCLMNPLPSATKAPADSAPIDVYDAQTGSGTYSTWTGSGAADYSAGTNGLTTPGITCSTCEAGWPSGDSSTKVSAHSNLFENQMSDISQQPDAKDAMYFMSYGKFTTTCPAKKDQQEAGASGYKSEAVCAGTVPTGTTGTAADTYVTYGELGGIEATEATVQDAVLDTGTVFPVTRNLYNLYNNSSAGHPSSQATLNYVGEDGFLCKSSTAADVDPQTGLTYRVEIESTIKSYGFFPLDVNGVFISEGVGSLTFPGAYTDTGYEANDVSNTFEIGGVAPTYSNTGTTGMGYCQVTNG